MNTRRETVELPWAKMSDDTQRSERILALSVPARWLWVAAIMENRGYTVPGQPHGRSPFISVVRAEALARHQGVPLKHLKELEHNGRFEPVEGGWNIHHYGQFLPSRREEAAEHEPDPVKQAAGRKSAAQRQQTGNTYKEEAVTEREQATQQTGNPARTRARGPVPVVTTPDVVVTPVPVPSTAPLPSLPTRADAVKDPATELGLGMHELFGRVLSQQDLIECQLALNQYAYMTASDLIVRAHDHVSYCSERGLPTPRTVAGFTDTWRRENDHRADTGAPKAERISNGRTTGMAALGDLLPTPKEASS